ncbi:hypothetical protein RFI_23425 [Reticulomyxa filosa]|uniref:Uncharacterized protein n=1 Tax=Reticulomyxa filosa TaxID=46433 RepID=X6MKH7_RETFI|nr:hypothetical protein RFI_23425 [Reticulomyxa filosa]|eukprot:ETO13942.1 hypothetical protein RFI_23425 [Reticulomyxa filosa]
MKTTTLMFEGAHVSTTRTLLPKLQYERSDNVAKGERRGEQRKEKQGEFDKTFFFFKKKIKIITITENKVAQYQEMSANKLRLRYYKKLNMIPKPSPLEQVVIAKQLNQQILPTWFDIGLPLKANDKNDQSIVGILNRLQIASKETIETTNMSVWKQVDDTRKETTASAEATSESPLLSPLSMSFQLDVDNPLSKTASAISLSQKQTPKSVHKIQPVIPAFSLTSFFFFFSSPLPYLPFSLPFFFFLKWGKKGSLFFLKPFLKKKFALGGMCMQ